MHHDDPSQLHRVGMMLECSPGELLARAAFMHHDDQGQDALRHDAVLKGLRWAREALTDVCDDLLVWCV